MDSIRPDQPTTTRHACTNQLRASDWTDRTQQQAPILATVTFPARIGESTTEHTSYVVRPVYIDTRAGLLRFHAYRQPMSLGRGAISVQPLEAGR